MYCKEDSGVDAAVVFGRLDDKRERELRSRFEYWIDGGVNDKWFHGFNQDGYRGCFVFKWKISRQHHRMYGFLCHPTTGTNRRFQLCVLASHARKNQEATDVTDLDGVNSLRLDPLVGTVIKIAFPDRGGSPSWVN